MPKFSLYSRKIREAFRLAAPRVLEDVVRFCWLLAAIAIGWFFYHSFVAKEVVPVKISWIEEKSAPLLGALEKFHAGKGTYPKLLRDMDIPPNEYGLDFMYEGADRVFVISEACAETPTADACWDGYRRFKLMVVSSGKTYEFSSVSRRWEDQSPSVGA